MGPYKWVEGFAVLQRVIYIQSYVSLVSQCFNLHLFGVPSDLCGFTTLSKEMCPNDALGTLFIQLTEQDSENSLYFRY